MCFRVIIWLAQVAEIPAYSVDQQILQHMIDSQAEFIMEVTDKTKADVKVGYSLATFPASAEKPRLGWYSHRL